MLVQLSGMAVYGTVLEIATEPPMVQAKITKFFGVLGESELRGGRGGRMIHVHMLIYKNYGTYGALRQTLLSLDRETGQRHGELRIMNSGNERKIVDERFPYCTFLGFEKDSGHQAGPLPDEAGTLDGGWWVMGTLRFRQLVIPR